MKVIYNAMKLDLKKLKQQVINDMKHLSYGKIKSKINMQANHFWHKMGLFIATYTDNNL